MVEYLLGNGLTPDSRPSTIKLGKMMHSPAHMLIKTYNLWMVHLAQLLGTSLEEREAKRTYIS